MAAHRPRHLTGDMTTLRTLVLLAATVSAGLGAGVYALYAHTIVPGLRGLDDRSFVGAFQALDRAILNPWFLGGSFVGSIVLAAAAAVLCLRRPELPWAVVAVVLLVAVTAVTIVVHVPLNDGVKAAGDPATMPDPGAVRAAFDEARWQAWNLVRTGLAAGAFALLAWALVVHGRAS